MDDDYHMRIDELLAACDEFNAPAAAARVLSAEVRRLKAAVQLHHDQRGDDRCFLDDLKLYHDVLGIKPDPYVTAMPPEADAEESCRRYRNQRQCPAVAGSYPMPGGMTIRQLTEAAERYQAENAMLRAEVDRLTAAGPDRASAPGPRCLCMRARSSACPVHGTGVEG